VKSDEAKVKTAEGVVAAAQVNLDYCNIRSPINGRAGLRLVDVGNVVTGGNGGGGGAVLLTIQGLDPIYTDFTVAETDLALVRRYAQSRPCSLATGICPGAFHSRFVQRRDAGAVAGRADQSEWSVCVRGETGQHG